MKSRRGITLVEALVVIAVAGLILAVLLPAVQGAREAARRKQCANNLHQFGIALASYRDSLRSVPPGFIATFDLAGFDEYVTANTLLLPYLEESSLHSLYDRNRPWYLQSPQVAQTVVPIFVCPSARQVNPFHIPILASDPGIATGGVYALTNYLFCKGLNDAWCAAPEMVSGTERGMFDVNFAISHAAIQDGISNTIAMGEGAGGSDWPLCSGPGCALAAAADPSGNWPHAGVPWLAPTVYPDFVAGAGFLGSSNLACTLESLNKNPVTHSMVAVASTADCRCSLQGGQHHTSNFRSDHPGGGSFLLADGSVHFLHHVIDMTTYRRLSTVADGSVVEIP